MVIEFIERSDHYLELRSDGTYTKHFTKFGHAMNQKIRVDIDPVTKAETSSFIAVKNIISVEKTTGDVVTIKRDFDPRREILGAEIHDDPSIENIVIDAVDYPSDMQDPVDGRPKYKWNKNTNRLIVKV